MSIQSLSTVISKIFAPNSLAAIPEGEQGYDEKIATEVAPNLSMIQPGDLILTRTSSSFYHILRTFTSEPYDHIAVVLNDKLVLHIGPGRIRTLSLVRLLEPQRSPLALRPMLSPEERELFVQNCWSMIGDSYDLVRIFDFLLRLILLNWTSVKIPFKKVRVNLSDGIFTEPNDTKNRQWVCSDAIMTQLTKVHPKYKEFLIEDRNSENKMKDIMLNNLGSLTIQDFVTMAQQSRDLFKTIELPLAPETSSTASTLLDRLQQIIAMFHKLSVSQKLLVGILIIYMLNALFVPNRRRIKSNL